MYKEIKLGSISSSSNSGNRLSGLSFFLVFTGITELTLIAWFFSPNSYILFVICLWVIAFTPFILSRYSIYEPISIYLGLFLPAFSVKPLLNEYLSSNGDNFLFYLSEYENLYNTGLPTAALTILVYVYILHIFYAWAIRLKRNVFFEMRLEARKESKKIQAKELRIWKRVAKIGLAIYIPAFVYFIAVIQGFNYAEYAINRNELLRGQGLAWLLACLGTPLAITYVFILLEDNASKIRKILYILLIVFCIISGQFISPGRGNILNIVIASLVLYWWVRKDIPLVRIAIMVVIFIIFSFFVLYVRELTTEAFDMNIAIYFLVQDVGLFDYYSIYLGQVLSNDFDLSLGGQLLRNFYIFLPRVLFPFKPALFSTLEIQNFSQIVPIEISNVSISPFSEWVFNFGIPGVALGSVMLAAILAGFFRLLANGRSKARLMIYVLVLPIFVIGHVKGGFSLAIMFFVLSPAWVILAIYFSVRYFRVSH